MFAKGVASSTAGRGFFTSFVLGEEVMWCGEQFSVGTLQAKAWG